jgi:hypothetical protein
MEWNHFLPQCIFGDQPIGHYLLLRQHAIATALQTLAFKKNCLCGWHLDYLPDALRQLTHVYYIEAGRKIGEENKRLNRGICDPEVHKLDHVVEAKRQNGLRVSQHFMEQSLGIFNPQFRQKIHAASVQSGNAAYENKTGIHDPENKDLVLKASRYALENEKGIFDPKNKEKVLEGSKKSGEQAVENKTGIFNPDYDEKRLRVARNNMLNLHSAKDASGKSAMAVNNARILHSKKDENGKSIVAMKASSQVWESLIDGHRSTASGVARYNRKNGWDPAARVRIL